MTNWLPNKFLQLFYFIIDAFLCNSRRLGLDGEMAWQQIAIYSYKIVNVNVITPASQPAGKLNLKKSKEIFMHIKWEENELWKEEK